MATLSDTAGDGDRLATLRVLRDVLARQIDATDSARDMAALSQRLMDVLEQVAVIEKAVPESKGTPLDEVAKRRAERKTAPARTTRPAQRRK